MLLQFVLALELLAAIIARKFPKIGMSEKMKNSKIEMKNNSSSEKIYF
jgi:hypothetical protein